VVTDAKLLRFLRRYRLAFTVIDYLEDEDDGESKMMSTGNEGLIGKAEVNFTALADGGEDIVDHLDLLDDYGKKAGKLRVSGYSVEDEYSPA